MNEERKKKRECPVAFFSLLHRTEHVCTYLVIDAPLLPVRLVRRRQIGGTNEQLRQHRRKHVDAILRQACACKWKFNIDRELRVRRGQRIRINVTRVIDKQTGAAQRRATVVSSVSKSKCYV
jgi:hypothetical protein